MPARCWQTPAVLAPIGQALPVAEYDGAGRVRAAGGVVWRDVRGRGIEVLLVHRPRYDDWTIPKGKADAGESDEEAAIREVEEETGLPCELGPELASSEYIDRNGRPKIVRFWSMKAVAGRFRPQDEVDVIEWMSVGDAHGRLTYERDRQVLDSATGLLGEISHGRPSSDVLLLVRHAVAVRRREWADADDVRPLTKVGQAQAEGLVAAFEGMGLTRLMSSPSLRCLDTLRPLAATLGVRIEVADELAEGGAEEAVALALSLVGSGVALCSHGDVLPPVLDSLISGGGTSESAWAKGATWRVDGRTVPAVRELALYLPPLVSGAANSN